MSLNRSLAFAPSAVVDGGRVMPSTRSTAVPRPASVVPTFAPRALPKRPLLAMHAAPPSNVLRPTRNAAQLSLFERPPGTR